ncbi:hypothetical protein D3C75_672870 [compost metagenome]
MNNPLSLNLYAYVSNNPLVYSDPSGHAPATGAGSIGTDGGTAPTPSTPIWVKAGKGAYALADAWTFGELSDYVNEYSGKELSAKQFLDAAGIFIQFVPISAAEAKALQIGQTAEKQGVSLIRKAGRWIKLIFKGKGKGKAIEEAANFLSKPAKKNGILNIGAGGKPIEGAYNIDLAPKAKGVYFGDAKNLSKIKTGSQSKIYIENPYEYDPLNSEVLRVLSRDGEIIITGSRSNLNKILRTLDDKGLKIKGSRREIPNNGSYKTTNGDNIKSKMLDQYTIIRK